MDCREIHGRRLCLHTGDITRLSRDALVTAANPRLAGGAGVDGAIHAAAGPSLLAELRRLGGCPAGEARITGAGNLQARYVIHAVGPVWHGGMHGEPELLASAYASSLRLAHAHGVKTIAFPSISTGVYGYPVAQAARIALQTLWSHLQGDTGLVEVTMVLFSASDRAIYEHTLANLVI